MYQQINAAKASLDSHSKLDGMLLHNGFVACWLQGEKLEILWFASKGPSFLPVRSPHLAALDYVLMCLETDRI